MKGEPMAVGRWAGRARFEREWWPMATDKADPISSFSAHLRFTSVPLLIHPACIEHF
jgi:hypothetical protein